MKNQEYTISGFMKDKIESNMEKRIKIADKSFVVKINAETALMVKSAQSRKEDDFTIIKEIITIGIGKEGYYYIVESTTNNPESASILEETALVIVALVFGIDPDDLKKQLESEDGKKFIEAMTQLKMTGN